MSAAVAARPAAFSRGGALVLVVGGLGLFLAMLWLIGAGEDFGGTRGQGQAHAASNGLNGYAGLVRLVEAQGYSVERSRSRAALKTGGLLVITPGTYAEAEEIAEILDQRKSRGPTLVIMPKWFAMPPGPAAPPAARAKFKRGWVRLIDAAPVEWAESLPGPYRFEHKIFPAPMPEVAALPENQPPPRSARPQPPARWGGMGLAGVLPTAARLHAKPATGHDALITDDAGRVLAFGIDLEEKGDTEDLAVQPVIFLAEPDLANNYGLADPTRAAAALALVATLTERDDIDQVTFDMTLNGFGASENLLTLAFRPPFLAATLSLLVALLIVGWRAFRRFGPAASAGGPDIAFGKRQLIANGAGLILRARRFRLLGKPYADLAARRLAERLGLARHDAQAIDVALARRLPGQEPFTRRAARLEAAEKPADILAAAQSLDDLASRLQQGQSSA